VIPQATEFLGRRVAFAAQLSLLLVGMVLLGGLWWEWPARPYATLPLAGTCLGLRVSQDGSTLLAVQTDRLTLWDLASLTRRGGCEFPTWQFGGMFEDSNVKMQVEELWLSADGRKLAFECPTKNQTTSQIRLLNLDLSDSPVIMAERHGELSETAPDSPVLVNKGENAYRFWEVATGQELYQGQVEREGVQDVCALPDGRVLVVREERQTGWLWDECALSITDLSRSSTPIRLPGARGPAKVVAGGRRLVATCAASMLLVDLRTRQLIREFVPAKGLHSIRYEQGRLLVLSPPTFLDPPVAQLIWYMQVWDLADEQPAVYGPFARNDAPWPALSPDARWGAFWHRPVAATTLWHGELVDLHTRELASRIDDNLTSPLKFSPGGRYLTAYTERQLPPSLWQRLMNWGAAVNGDVCYAVKVWSVPDGRELAAFPDERHLAFISDRELAVTGKDGKIELWRIPHERSTWVEYGLPGLFCLLVFFLARELRTFRRGLASTYS
jgi:WD40 repeat protein